MSPPVSSHCAASLCEFLLVGRSGGPGEASAGRCGLHTASRPAPRAGVRRYTVRGLQVRIRSCCKLIDVRGALSAQPVNMPGSCKPGLPQRVKEGGRKRGAGLAKRHPLSIRNRVAAPSTAVCLHLCTAAAAPKIVQRARCRGKHFASAHPSSSVTWFGRSQICTNTAAGPCTVCWQLRQRLSGWAAHALVRAPQAMVIMSHSPARASSAAAAAAPAPGCSPPARPANMGSNRCERIQLVLQQATACEAQRLVRCVWACSQLRRKRKHCCIILPWPPRRTQNSRCRH